jgi:LysR family glycine cleavage system transcriptional activator
VQGQGLVLSRWSLANQYLADGQLVMASDCAIPYGYDCYFVCPPGYLALDKVQTLRQWLLGHGARMPRPGRVLARQPGN